MKAGGDEAIDVQSLTSPGADYGLSGSDRFDPSRYDFYNALPSPSSKQRTLAAPAHSTSSSLQDGLSSPKMEGFASPHQLAPIEESDDGTPGERDEGGSVDLALNPSNRSHAATIQEPKSSAQWGSHSQALEKASDFLFSREHLQMVLGDRHLAQAFGAFLYKYEPSSVEFLARLKNLMKALRSIDYAQAIVRALEGSKTDSVNVMASSIAMPWVIEDKIEKTLEELAAGAFRTFVIDTYRQAVIAALAHHVSGKPDPATRAIGDIGLAEAFVLSDPAQTDNPLVFTSDEYVPSLSILEVTGQGWSRRDTFNFALAHFAGLQDKLRELTDLVQWSKLSLFR